MSASRPTSWCVRLPVILALAFASACGEDPVGPGVHPGPFTRVEVADTVSSVLSAASAEASFSFRPAESGTMALFGVADGPVVLSVEDSISAAGQLPLAFLFPRGAAGDGVLERRSERFTVTAGRTYVVRARHPDLPATARFRFLLHPVNAAPEHRPPAASLEEIVSGTLENSADIDEFQFAGKAGDELIAYLEADDTLASGAVGLGILTPGGAAVGSVTSEPGSTDLEALATGRFILPADGTYRVAVRGGVTFRSTGPNVGGYRWQLSRIDRAPEGVPAAAALGDTVNAAIERVGDVDEFVLSGTPGDEFNFFLQALTTPPRGIRAEFVGVATPHLQHPFESRGQDTSLYAVASGTIVMSPSGTVGVRVLGIDDHLGLHRGDYRFFAFPILRAPETAAEALTLGQSVEEEIELPGDVDEFLLTVPASGLANLVLETLGGGGSLTFERLDPIDDSHHGSFLVFAPEDGGPGGWATDIFELPEGVYRLRISGSSAADGFRGRYRISTHTISTAPEIEGATVGYDTQVSGEAIAPLGDLDQFTFQGSRGDVLTVWFQPLAGAAQRGLGIGVWRADAAVAFAGTGQDFGRDSVETGRLVLPATEPYRLIVSGDGRVPGNEGAYRFTLRRLSVLPEQAPPAVTPGTVVTAESIDHLGDVDEFVLTAVPGTELQVTVLGIPQRRLKLEVASPVGYDSLKGTETVGDLQATGRFLMPAGGEVRIRVYEPGYGGFSATGPYRFSVIPVDRAPETIAASLTPGVVAEGEALEYLGDIDEFTFGGVAGQIVRAYLQTPQGFDGLASAILEVLPPGSEVVLGSVISHNPTPSITTQSTGPITLEETGTYRIRVRSTDDRDGTAAYRLLVQ